MAVAEDATTIILPPPALRISQPFGRGGGAAALLRLNDEQVPQSGVERLLPLVIAFTLLSGVPFRAAATATQ